MKQKIEIKYFIILLFITTIFFLSMMSFFVKRQKNMFFLDKLLKDGFHYLSYTIQFPIQKIEESIDKMKETKDLYEKYESLKEEIEKTNFMTSRYNESLKVIQELEEMLDLNATLMENEYINATIISRNLGFWYDKVTIDKGSTSGIQENQAVITSDGLIGRVISVSYFTSDIKLLTSSDINQKVSVKIKIEDDYVYGLLTGYNTKTKEFILEGIAGNKEIPIHSEVTTPGLGDIFPSGILIGYVNNITKDHFDLARTLTVTSNVDFEGVSYVTVLKRVSS